MSNINEGFRRLSILFGAVASVAWFVFVLFASDGFTGMDAEGWAVLFVGMTVCMFGGMYLVRGIAWVLQGFRRRDEQQ
jgi:hypothetical protein